MTDTVQELGPMSWLVSACQALCVLRNVCVSEERVCLLLEMFVESPQLLEVSTVIAC